MAHKTFLQKNIIELLGLKTLPTGEKLRIINKITDLVARRLMLRVAEEIKEEDEQEAERVFTSGSEEEKLKFLKNKVNFQKLLEEEVVKIKQELKERVEKLKS